MNLDDGSLVSHFWKWGGGGFTLSFCKGGGAGRFTLFLQGNRRKRESGQSLHHSKVSKNLTVIRSILVTP